MITGCCFRGPIRTVPNRCLRCGQTTPTTTRINGTSANLVGTQEHNADGTCHGRQACLLQLVPVTVRRPASRSPLRSTRRERRLRQPDHRPRVRLSEPPRQESGAGLSACHRARTPERPRSRRVDGCQRELSPRTVATPVGRNRQPSVRQGDGLRRSALSQRVRGPRAMTLLHRSRADGARMVLGRAGIRLPIRSTFWRTCRARRNPPGCARSR
jgi:hypothetical protein